MRSAYRRVLLKLSGEAFMGKKSFGIDRDILNSFADQIEEVKGTGVELAMVIGGGNIFRGVSAASEGMNRVNADYMGMLGTVINALAFQEVLEQKGLYTRVQSALSIAAVAEPYIRRRATRHLEKGRIVIFAAGTGSPYFTTDTAAALRAMEIGADVILKATKVDGIFDKDPMLHKDAKKFERLTYMEVLEKQLKVMDSTATSLCMDNALPIIVFDVTQRGNMLRAVRGEPIGTIVQSE